MNKPTNPLKDADELLSVHMTRILPAPPKRVFEAWTSADQIKRWWGPEGFVVLSAKADPRPGGEFEVEIKAPDGEIHLMRGVYLEAKRHSLVVIEIRHRQFEGAAERPEGYIPTNVHVELAEHGDGTELTLTHTGFLDAALVPRFNAGWSGGLDKLAAILSQ